MLDDPAIDVELACLSLTGIWGIAGRLARRLAALGTANPLALKRNRQGWMGAPVACLLLSRGGSEGRG